MNFNDKFFHFPTFLSTSWSHVSALTLNPQGCLMFIMVSDDVITLPLLPKEVVEKIFIAHATFLENQVLNQPIHKPSRPILNPKENGEPLPFRFSFGSLEGMGTNLQHNPNQKNIPNLPEEMLTKLAEVSRILAPSDPDQLPKAEPHCNCYHCQIARALSGQVTQGEAGEEQVTSEDLHFEQWEITQTGEKLFSVTNKLDQMENYSVHLGTPIGCTCGKEKCEHIHAVLQLPLK